MTDELHKPAELADSPTAVGGHGHGHSAPPALPEPSDVSNKAVIGIALLVIVLTTAAIGFCAAVFLEQPRDDLKQIAPSPLAYEKDPVAAPHLQYNAALDMQALRAAQLKELDSYGWSDRAKGLARIPIGQAMKLVLDKKLLPVRDSQEPTAAGAPQPPTAPPAQPTAPPEQAPPNQAPAEPNSPAPSDGKAPNAAASGQEGPA